MIEKDPNQILRQLFKDEIDHDNMKKTRINKSKYQQQQHQQQQRLCRGEEQ